MPIFLVVWLCSGSVPLAVSGARPPESGVVEYRGLCDASAAAALDAGRFVAANDEDNVLAVYRLGIPEPESTLPMDGFLDLSGTEKNPETDIEAAAAVGDLIFWITSHGRDKDGEWRGNRHRLFATRLVPAAEKKTGVGSRTGKSGGRNPENAVPGGPAVPVLEPAGEPYSRLEEDLLADPGLAGLGLPEATAPRAALRPDLAPKKGGLNIEGLAAAPGTRTLLIGFRNPVPGGRALVIPLLNPEDLVFTGGRARFGPPVLLDLNGLGVRCMEYVEALGAFLVLGGGKDGIPGFRAFSWKGGNADPAIPLPRLDARIREAGLAPEAVALFPREGGLLVLSDDGDRMIRAARGEPCPCKKLKKRPDRRFRGLWVNLNGLIFGSDTR